MIRKEEKISVITLGCSKNVVDSERLLRQLQLNNFTISADPGKADTILINTCGFINPAKEESINTILNAVALKKKGQIKKVYVTGCLSERYQNDLKSEIPEVDAFFGVEDYKAILTKLGGNLKTELLGERILSTPTHTAYLKISEGCDHPCSFCAIPIMRGKHKSKKINELVKEAEFLAASGTKELIIIAQDTTDYGRDLYGKQVIHKLLSNLSRVDGIEWIRLMYTYPSKFPEELIDVIGSNPKICNYIDIPLQHISDNVLRSMRRGVTSKRIRELLGKLRKNIPGITLRTTFITGYPNEGDIEFQELYNFAEEVKFDKLGVFTYSREENTAGFILGDPVPEEIKSERKDQLMNLQKEISSEINRNLIGMELSVLIDRKEGDFYVGRSYRDAPEGDGEVLIDSSRLRLQTGNFYMCEVYDSNEYDLYARPLLSKRKSL